MSVITEIDVSHSELESLRGIEYFTALTSLSCYFNVLTEIDVSQNIALTELECQGNQLTSLDVSKNTALEDLQCEYNLLIRLDLSKNTALTQMYCYHNPGESGKFTVTAWFGSDAIPEGFTTGTWDLISGQTVVIEYVKAEMKIENAYKL